MDHIGYLDGTVVAVSGVTSGIGQACAQQLIRQGYKVLGISRREDRLRAQRANWGEHAFYGMVCDITDPDAIRAQLKQVPEQFRPVSKLINNAGLIQGQGELTALTQTQIDRMIDTNIKGMVALTQSLMDEMIGSRQGHIVNITSLGAHYHYQTGHVYAASKAFADHFGRCLHADLAEKRVRVTNIAPGKTLTEFSLVQFEGDTTKASRPYEGIDPLTADDVATAVLWALNQPTNVNINRIEMMPAGQNLSFR